MAWSDTTSSTFRTVFCLTVFFTSADYSSACRYTPLRWQQTVDRHADPRFIGQRKHLGWSGDPDGDFVDDRFRSLGPGQSMDVTVALNTCLPPPSIAQLLSPYGDLRYVGKLVTFAMLDGVPYELLDDLAALPEVAMVESRAPLQYTSNVSVRSVEARASNTYGPAATGLTGAGVNIAILDSGVDDSHQSFAGAFIAGFDATLFEDANGNGIDDDCDAGTCSGPSYAPNDGSQNPAAANDHGTHIAGIALGRAVSGSACSTPDDGSTPIDCAGVAPGAGLVDIRIGGATQISAVDVAEGLDWLGRNVATHNIRVANMSSLNCTTNSDGTDTRSQQINYIAALGVVFVMPLGNWSIGDCNLGPSTPNFLPRVPEGAAASRAITVASTDDNDTVSRADDTRPLRYLVGPRQDYASSPDPLALKPDLASPGRDIFAAQAFTANGFLERSGTSESAPHVAGAAALLLQQEPDMNPGSLKQLLRSSADRSVAIHMGSTQDPNWDRGMGYGILNVDAALQSMAAADPGFPSCAGPPSSPGQPCALSGAPAWNNATDITTTSPPQISIPTTIQAAVRNRGANAATALVTFGVYVFAAGNNQFHHIGTQTVTLSPGASTTVAQAWTPAAADHQCIQVSIEYGLDTDFDDNVTQRNLQVAPSVYTVQIENPYPVPATLELELRSERLDWPCVADATAFTLDPLQDCPRTVLVDFAPPKPTRLSAFKRLTRSIRRFLRLPVMPLLGAPAGARADCHLSLFARREGDEKRELVGGVTMQTFVPAACRVVGSVVDASGRPLQGVVLRFSTALVGREADDALAAALRGLSRGRTDRAGAFSLRLVPHLSYVVTVQKPGLPAREIELRPTCGIGAVRLVVDDAGGVSGR